MLESNALWKFPYFYWHKPQHFNLAREELHSNPCYKELVSWDSRVLLMALPFICWMTPGKPFNHHCISLMLFKKKITVCVLESKKTLNIRWSHIIWVGLRNMHGKLMFLKLGCWVFFWKNTPNNKTKPPKNPNNKQNPKHFGFDLLIKVTSNYLTLTVTILCLRKEEKLLVWPAWPSVTDAELPYITSHLLQGISPQSLTMHTFYLY